MRSTVFKKVHEEFISYAKQQGLWTPEFEESNRELTEYLDRFADEHGIEAVYNPSSVLPYEVYGRPSDHPLWSKKE